MTSWISVDPGKHTGLVAWEGDRIIGWDLAEPPQRMDFVDWHPYIVDRVGEFGRVHRATVMAIEQPFIDPSMPAPELNALVRSLRTLARRQKWTQAVYPQSTVKAKIRPRGMGHMDDKDMLRLAVKMVYGIWTEELPQDVIDSIAVGHCHLAATGEARILQERAIDD